MQTRHANLRLIDNPGRIAPTAMNRGIDEARGDCIVRIDGHTIVDSDYVRESIAALRRSGAACVGGRMEAVSETLCGRVIACATSSPFGVGGARFHYSQQEETVDTVYLGAWWREQLKFVGGFDEELVRNQDDELNARFRERGMRVLLSPSIKSVYYNRSTIRKLWRQYYQYGYWKVRVMQKHPRGMCLRHFVAPAFVLSIIVALMLAAFGGALGLASLLPLLAVTGVYLAANLTASISVARRHGWSLLPLLPLAFATLHFAYGTGFLIGLIRFAARWFDSANAAPKAAALRR